MTNPIAGDTCNFALNILKGWRLALGQAAFELGVSMGALIKDLLLAGAKVKLPELYRKLKEIEAKRFAETGARVVVSGALILSVLINGLDQRSWRPSRNARRRDEAGEVFAC